MYELVEPPRWLTVAFVLWTAVVVIADVALVRRSAPIERRSRWTLFAMLIAASWVAAHAIIAESGLLEGTGFPPPAMPYLLTNVIVALVVVVSPVGRRLSELPLAWLIGLQAFRLPLEWLLHELYRAGTLPVQMTWSGYNFDVLTAVGALAVAGALFANKPVPRPALWGWNVLGLALLIIVVAIATLSAPFPFRQFHNEPAVLLVFHAPFNWIVNVHVFTALVGHLVIFRALTSRTDAEA